MISKNDIDCGKVFDFGLTSGHYAKYRDIYPRELYDRLLELGVAADNSSWLDLGTGTGILPQNMYNPRAKIVGVDISKEQIAFAKQSAQENGWNIEYFARPAESTGLPSKSFDCITAAQCFGYFDRDRIKTEVKRLLKPGGKLIKIYMDWCFDDEITAKSVDLVKRHNTKWNPKLNGDKEWYDDLFDGRITEEFYCDIPFTRESWHGRMCACRGTLASMDGGQFGKWSTEHKRMLQDYPEAFAVRHKISISYFTL